MKTITDILKGRVGVSHLGQLLVNQVDGEQGAVPMMKTFAIASPQVLTLFSVPQIIVAAPGAGLAYVPHRWMVHKPAGVAYAGIAAGEDLILRYSTTNLQCLSAIETTGFLDQATAQTRVAGMFGATGVTPADYSIDANRALVAQLLLGDITTGTSLLKVRVWYDIVQIPF
jgi:hypothetical protein